MRVVDFKEFVRMPEGTLFCVLAGVGSGRRCEGLLRKGETIFDERGRAIDFYAVDVLPVMACGCPALMTIEQPAYQPKVKYVVYEDADVDQFARALGFERIAQAVT